MEQNSSRIVRDDQLVTTTKLLNVDEAAALLGVKPSTIYQWKHQEYIPHVKLRGNLRFRIEDLYAWIEKQSKGGRTSRRVEVDL